MGEPSPVFVLAQGRCVASCLVCRNRRVQLDLSSSTASAHRGLASIDGARLADVRSVSAPAAIRAGGGVLFQRTDTSKSAAARDLTRDLVRDFVHHNKRENTRLTALGISYHTSTNHGEFRAPLVLQRSPLVRINDSCLKFAEAHRKLGLALPTVVWACSGDRYNRNEINSRGGTPTFLSKKSLFSRRARLNLTPAVPNARRRPNHR